MIDVRMFTVGPVQENCFVVRRKGSDSALVIDPGDEAQKLLQGLDALQVKTVEAILITHTHFDHIGAVAPVAEATKAPVYCPEGEKKVLANIMDYVPWPVLFTPGHSPGHVTYAIADEGALFSGDVLFQGSVGRVDLPGGDWTTLLASIEALMNAYPPETTVYPGHMGVTTLGRERATNPFLRELAHPS
jgi:glyoxylase-like metal-dependent hydrolase (beta-lactamase superfamily II)